MFSTLKRMIQLSFVTGVCLLHLWGCQSDDAQVIKIGTLTGPESDVIQAAQDKAADLCGIKLKVVPFNDYNLPNQALQDGSIDANIFQHRAYLELATKMHHYDFQILGETFLFPLALYSEKHQDLKSLPKRAVIALPNDPSNESRALNLLAHGKLIKLDPKAGKTPSLKDITSNPKSFRFKPLDAAQLARVLPDVDGAIINTTFALPAGLNPLKDGLLHETLDSPYVNIIVTQRTTIKLPQLMCVVKAIHSNEVREQAKERFGNAAIPAWQDVL